MENLLWKVFALILTTIMIFIVPITLFYDRMDTVSYNVAYEAVNEFADESRELGVVNKYNYDRFMSKLNSTGISYDVDIEHYKKVYLPVLDDAGVETGEIRSVYEGVYDADIVSGIYEDDYVMEAGDMLYVQISNNTNTIGEIIKGKLTGVNASKGTIYARGGGMVHSNGSE